MNGRNSTFHFVCAHIGLKYMHRSGVYLRRPDKTGNVRKLPNKQFTTAALWISNEKFPKRLTVSWSIFWHRFYFISFFESTAKFKLSESVVRPTATITKICEFREPASMRKELRPREMKYFHFIKLYQGRPSYLHLPQSQNFEHDFFANILKW